VSGQSVESSTTHSLALCGAGMISVAHASAASLLGVPVVAVASRDPRTAVARTGQTGGAAVLYEELPAGADIVAVCTPPAQHAEHTLQALRAGAAVILEKPLCTTLDEADAIVEAAEQAGQRLLYAENLAYAPVVRELLDRVGRLGTISHLEVRTIQSLPTWGAFTSTEWGGGALFDLGAHPLAIALLCASAAGCGDVISVSASLTGGDGHDSDEHAEVSLRFADGLRARIVSSWRGADTPQWDVQVASATGVLRAELQPAPILEHDGEPVELPPGRPELGGLEWAGYLGQVAAFIDDIDSGSTPFMDARFGRTVLEVTCAAYWSAGQDGTEVSLPFAGPRDQTPLQLWHG
jgi:myo-inositol 2-dehydrogenase / D-chiro-inositol 1-dehydrogenase